jgi:histone-lysine N-methyltransferase SETMAR
MLNNATASRFAKSLVIPKVKQFVIFSNDAMGVTQIKEWYNRFKNDRTSVDSDQRTDRPSTSRNPDVINKVRSLIMEDHRLTVQEIANDIVISDGSAHAILTDDLGMRRVAAKFVPKLLSCEQKEFRLDIAQDMLDCVNGDLDFLKTMTTGDESWVYGYDPKIKAQSLQWKSPSSSRPKKARQVRSKVKVMLNGCLFVWVFLQRYLNPQHTSCWPEFNCIQYPKCSV